jgi:acetoin utilization protein AcuA
MSDDRNGLFGIKSFFKGWRQAPLLEGAAKPEKKELPPTHRKNTSKINTPGGEILVENYYPPEFINELFIDNGICMFSRGNLERQKRALVKVGETDGGNIIVGIRDRTLVSFIGIHHPFERERWGKAHFEWLMEVGAIEVSRNFRDCGLAHSMLEAAFSEHYYDDKIVLTTGLSWHWDLEGTGMDKMEYRMFGARLFGRFGFHEVETDEPNVAMDQANILLVREGKKVTHEQKMEFASLLFTNDWERTIRAKGAGPKPES